MGSFERLVFSILAIVVFLIPTWIFLGVRMLFSPEGFWQNLVLAGLGLWALGAFQLFCLIFLGIVLYSLWTDQLL